MTMKFSKIAATFAFAMLVSQGAVAQEVGVCEVRAPDEMNPFGSPLELSNGDIRLDARGDGANFWLPPPVEAGTYELTFTLKRSSYGFYSPRVEIGIGYEVLDTFRVTSSSFQEYTVSFDIPNLTSSEPVGVRFESGSWAYSVDVQGAKLSCPIYEDEPGVQCGGDACSPSEKCCLGAQQAPIGCISPGATCSGLSVVSCDGQADCGGDTCSVQVGDNGGGVQCTDQQLPEGYPIICGNAEAQTSSCDEGYVCQRTDEGMQLRICTAE